MAALFRLLCPTIGSISMFVLSSGCPPARDEATDAEMAPVRAYGEAGIKVLVDAPSPSPSAKAAAADREKSGKGSVETVSMVMEDRRRGRVG
jgi:hypothetical protein